VNRALLLLLLAAVYAASLGKLPGAGASTAFDPLAPRPHAVERLIVAGKFADALPQASALRDSYPREPLVLMWVARAHHGLSQWREEASAWEAYQKVSPAPAESCPALPQAYERLGMVEAAVAAYGRCAEIDPMDPGLRDELAAAYARHGLVRTP